MEVHWKIHFLGGGGHKKQSVARGKLPKKSDWDSLQKGRGLAKKRAMHFMYIISSHEAEFSQAVFFELVCLTLAAINIYRIYRSNIYMTPIYARSNK